MIVMTKQYPKLLAFLQLFYPALYEELSRHSDKSDIVEANLVCSNNINSYQAIVFSEGMTKGGELLEVDAGKDSIAPYSWDWRWIFALKLMFEGNIIFPIKFQQKVIALPTGEHALTEIFFNILQNEFAKVTNNIMNVSTNEKITLHESFARCLNSTNL